jgi:hypothetical protein
MPTHDYMFVLGREDGCCQARRRIIYMKKKYRLLHNGALHNGIVTFRIIPQHIRENIIMIHNKSSQNGIVGALALQEVATHVLVVVSVL